MTIQKKRTRTKEQRAGARETMDLISGLEPDARRLMLQLMEGLVAVQMAIKGIQDLQGQQLRDATPKRTRAKRAR